MTTLMPGFREQLERRATTLAQQERVSAGAGRRGRKRRLHGRGLAFVILTGALGAGGVAYAAKGIWSPQLGNPNYGEPATVSTSPVPGDQLALLGVLRRPQNDQDRGAGTLSALKFQGKSMDGLRIDAIRRLGTTHAGGAVILMPVATARSFDPSIRRDHHDALCLFMATPEGGGGQTCSSLQDLRAGRMQIGSVGPPPEVVREQRRRMEREQRKMAAEARRERLTLTEYVNRQVRRRQPKGRPRFLVLPRQDESNWESNVVQVVPDGVAAVRYRAAGKVILQAVRDNVVIVRVKPATRSGGVGLAWLDAQGRDLQKGSRFPAVKP